LGNFRKAFEITLLQPTTNTPDEEDNLNYLIVKLAFRGKIPTHEISLNALQSLVQDRLAVEKDEELFATDKCRRHAENLGALANL
jgi:hypothetical protein